MEQHSEGLALRDAALAALWDNAPRKVYADWLDEHGLSSMAEMFRDDNKWMKPISQTPYLLHMMCLGSYRSATVSRHISGGSA